MSRPTPGPWTWDGNTLRAATADPFRSAVHSILDRAGGFGFLMSDRAETLAELEADYLLIEAAPEMLKALQALVRGNRHADALRAAEALLARLEGQP